MKSPPAAKELSTKKAPTTKKPSIKTSPKETSKVVEPTLASVHKELAAVTAKLSNLDQRMKSFEQQIIDANGAINKLLAMDESNRDFSKRTPRGLCNVYN
jgi:septal ring factor EnvC (AmiA/AmiB activator)